MHYILSRIKRKLNKTSSLIDFPGKPGKLALSDLCSDQMTRNRVDML